MAETTTTETAAESIEFSPADLLKETGFDWTEAIPTELAQDKLWEPLKGKPLPDLLKGYAEAQRYIGGAIRLPGKDAKPEDIAKFKETELGKLRAAGLLDGAPESPDKYEITRPEAALDLGWDEDREKAFREAAHKAGMSQPQVQAVLNFYAGMHGDQFKQAEALHASAVETLRGEWGPSYDAKLGRANRFLKETGEAFGIPELMSQTRLGDNPAVIRWVAALADTLVEHGAMEPTSTDLTAEQVDARIAEHMKDPRAKSGDPAWAEELHKLYQQKLGRDNRVLTTLK